MNIQIRNKIDDTPSSSNKDSSSQVKELLDSLNKTQSNTQNKLVNGGDTPFAKLLSQLSTEMMKTSAEEQKRISQQIQKEKEELHQEWERLKIKIQEEQNERSKFEQVHI